MSNQPQLCIPTDFQGTIRAPAPCNMSTAAQGRSLVLIRQIALCSAMYMERVTTLFNTQNTANSFITSFPPRWSSNSDYPKAKSVWSRTILEQATASGYQSLMKYNWSKTIQSPVSAYHFATTPKENIRTALRNEGGRYKRVAYLAIIAIHNLVLLSRQDIAAGWGEVTSD